MLRSGLYFPQRPYSVSGPTYSDSATWTLLLLRSGGLDPPLEPGGTRRRSNSHVKAEVKDYCAAVLTAVCRLSPGAERGLLSSRGAWTPEHGGFRLYSRGAWAELIRRMWDRPEPGIEFVSPTLVGRFLTTRPRKCPFLKLLLNLLQVSVLGFDFFGH